LLFEVLNNEVEVTAPQFDPGIISRPWPFQCAIKVRSPELEKLILSDEQNHLCEKSDAAKLQKILSRL